MNPSRRQLAVLSLLLAIGLLANNAGPGRVAARTATSENGKQFLQPPAADYLRQHGVFGRVDPSVNANQAFIEHRKITASDGGANDRFGVSVAISGSTVVVAAYLDAANRGSVYVFERNKAGTDNWGEVKKLTASDGAGGDIFGFSVRMSGDTIVVGAPGDDSFRGSVYIFERNTGGADNWGEVKKLMASGAPDFGAQFGETVGISGDTIVAGASLADSFKGAAYVFERNRGGANNWGEVKKLTASDGVTNDAFGTAVGISGDTVVAGAPIDDTSRGSAYIFERNNGGADNWGETRKVTASDRADNDIFGSSAEISGQTVIVGSPSDDVTKGSAYIFERNKGGADNWGEVRKITASDGAAGDLAGHAMAIDGDTVSIGARNDDSTKGAAYVFERNRGGADNWGQARKLTASDGAIGDLFGAVGISGNTIIMGAYGDDASKGSAYIFVSPDSQWVQQRKPTASDGTANDRFGHAVAISSDTFVAGAPLDDVSRGSAYVFERNRGGADNWGEVTRLTASDRAAGDDFGISIDISGDTIVVGAHVDDSAKGSAYVFERNRGGPDNWGEARKLTASDGVASDQFGYSVAISNDTIVVGARNDDSLRGSAYVFERNRGGANNWGEVRKLIASDAAPEDSLGTSIAISGDTLVVGANLDDLRRGAAYIFERNRGGADNWGEVRRLTASDRASGDTFATSVDIGGETIVVGAPSHDMLRGSAYLYERNKGGLDNWGEVRKVTASDGLAGDFFGDFVGISGDTVAVGASRDDSLRGSAYVIERNRGGADNWGEVMKLTASDGVGGDFFGRLGISDDTVVVGAVGDEANKGSAYVFNAFPEAVSVSAASFQRLVLAPEMIAAAFGIDLATGLELGGTIPLPTNLRGTTVSVKDSAGVERLADLFFVSPGQVNYLVPAGTSAGPATVKITSGSGQISYGLVEIAAVSPGIFAANSSGQGVAAALALRVRGTQQTYEQISRYDGATNSFVPIPVDLGPPEEQIFLVMYGTGFRFRSSEAGVVVRVGGRTLQSLYSGVATGYAGLDQLNISALPRDIVGAGVVNIEITIDGRAANTTTVSIR